MEILTFIFKTHKYHLTRCAAKRSTVADYYSLLYRYLYNDSDVNTGSSFRGQNDCKITGTKKPWSTLKYFTGLRLE